MPKIHWLIWFVLLILLVACGQAGDSTNENDAPVDEPFSSTGEPPATDESGYPSPKEGAYPAPNQDLPYPAPSLEESGNFPYPPPARLIDESKRASLSQPVNVSQQIINGSGPAGTPIKVVSISYAGEELGFATIDQDGTFEVALSRPIEKQEVLGLLLADDGLRSQFEGAPGTDIPMIGFVLDQAIVSP